MYANTSIIHRQCWILIECSSVRVCVLRFLWIKEDNIKIFKNFSLTSWFVRYCLSFLNISFKIPFWTVLRHTKLLLEGTVKKTKSNKEILWLIRRFLYLKMYNANYKLLEFSHITIFLLPTLQPLQHFLRAWNHYKFDGKMFLSKLVYGKSIY